VSPTQYTCKLKAGDDEKTPKNTFPLDFDRNYEEEKGKIEKTPIKSELFCFNFD